MICVNQIRKHCGTWEPRASELGSRTYSGLNDKGHCSALTGRRGEYSAPEPDGIDNSTTTGGGPGEQRQEEGDVSE